MISAGMRFCYKTTEIYLIVRIVLGRKQLDRTDVSVPSVHLNTIQVWFTISIEVLGFLGLL